MYEILETLSLPFAGPPIDAIISYRLPFFFYMPLSSTTKIKLPNSLGNRFFDRFEGKHRFYLKTS